LPDRRRLTFPVGLAAGAAAVVLAWLLFGGGSGPGGLEGDPGIPPPEYAYLDNARVLAYLAQIEGGLSASEKRTSRVTNTRTGGVSVGGVEAGGSASRDSFVEAVVTPTATTRFYRLLDRLADKDYMHELDASARPASFAEALSSVPEGYFVRISGCKLRLPTYVQMEEIITQSPGPISADRALRTALYGTTEELYAAQGAKAAAEGARALVSPDPPYVLPPGAERRLTEAAKRFASAIASNPRVPLASCSGRLLETPRQPDLLFPVELAALTKERSLLAGPVTIVGKLVRQVRRPDDVYVDRKAVATFTRAVDALDAALATDFGNGDAQSLGGELFADVSVLPQGAVVLPIAIYK
jgi:hypothetical protein